MSEEKKVDATPVEDAAKKEAKPKATKKTPKKSTKKEAAKKPAKKAVKETVVEAVEEKVVEAVEETVVEAVEEKVVEAVEEPKEEVEFDWDTYTKGIAEYSESEFDDFKSQYESALSTVSPNEVLDGVVVSLTEREVIVNVNYKSDAIISRNEFRYNEDLKAE